MVFKQFCYTLRAEVLSSVWPMVWASWNWQMFSFLHRPLQGLSTTSATRHLTELLHASPSQANKGPLRIYDLQNWDLSFQMKRYSKKFPVFFISYSDSFLRSIACYHVSGAGPFGTCPKCLLGLSKLFRSSGDRAITREVVWAHLAHLIFLEKK